MSMESVMRLSAAAIDADRLEAYYEGESRLATLGVTLPPQVRLLEMVINWPRLVVDSVEERLDVEGFRLADEMSTDDRMWSWWQENNLDEESSLAHLEALVQGCAFIIVGPGRGDVPAITVHTARGMSIRTDPLTREVAEATREYRDENGRRCVAHYTPDATSYFVGGNGGWSRFRHDQHGTGMVPVIPMVNRSRLSDRSGRSEMRDVMSLTDAASRTLTNLQIAQELVALPQRYVVGASPDDFVDENDKSKTAWESYIGRMMLLGDREAKPGQFPGANLQTFTEVMNLYARQVSAVSGLPGHFLGFTSENPPSAEAIRSSEARLVKRAERKQRAFGESWERALRCALRMVDGGEPEGSARLETVWRDPATPTVGAVTDAAVKLFQSEILPVDMTREMIGFTPEQRKRAAELDSDPVLAGLDEHADVPKSP